MMRLEHINLFVPDIQSVLAFYQAAFPHWSMRGEGNGDWYGKPRYWCHFGDDYNYITFNSPSIGENRDLTTTSTGLAHFAFEVSNLNEVIGRLETAGYEIAKDGADSPYRNNVYFLDPAGFEVEFVEYLTDVPALRNSYAE
ncbi:glyoxalase [Neiella marina]|uniref:Glyoxalase n=1 Tax=Neiella marina TaxID=508461 RepID=A0A8J2U4W9_9GAMM|nr:VOC family protein [Neiella marina]GGA76239.1 glyoxalase [Neiella marina]